MNLGTKVQLTRLFNEAKEKVLTGRCWDFYLNTRPGLRLGLSLPNKSLLEQAKEEVILPFPDIPGLEEESTGLLISGLFGRVEGETALGMWRRLRKEFVQDYNAQLDKVLGKSELHITSEVHRQLAELYISGVHEELLPHRMYIKWERSIHDLSLLAVSRIYFDLYKARRFVEEVIDEAILASSRTIQRKAEGSVGDQKGSEGEIFFNVDARSDLINNLSRYVNEDEQAELENLINGKPNTQKIIVNCHQNRLGKVFYNHYTKGCIQSHKTILAKWICQHFLRKTDGIIYELSEETILSHLKGKNLPRK